MKNINDNPCEDCSGSHCDKCDFFHANNPENDNYPVSLDGPENEDCLLDIEDYDDFDTEDDFQDLGDWTMEMSELDNAQDLCIGE